MPQIGILAHRIKAHISSHRRSCHIACVFQSAVLSRLSSPRLSVPYSAQWHYRKRPSGTVFTDGYRRASLYRLETFDIINRMVRSQELAVRTNLCVGPYGDEASIKHCAVVVDEHILTKFDAMPMVAMKRRCYGG